MIRWRHDQQNLAMDVDTGNVQIRDDQRRSLEKAVTMIRRRAHDLPQPQLHVRVSQPPNAQNFAFEVDMDLEVMGRRLSANGQGDDLPDAAGAARDKIVSQLGPFKAALRREQTYRPRHEVEASESAGARAMGDQNPEVKQFERDLEACWQPLVRQVSREIAALEMNNELPLGEMVAQDIVDEVIVRARERLQRGPAAMPLEMWLYQQAREVLKQRQEQLLEETPMSTVPTRSMKESLPPPPPPDPLTEDEDVLADLIEPAPEALPGEDIPEQAEPNDRAMSARRDELRRSLHKTISQMPPAWREALWLHYLDGFDLAEIAALQQQDEKQVRDNLQQATSYLRNMLYTWRGWQGQPRDKSQLRDQGGSQE